MISAGSLARDKQSGQLIYVCNDEGAPSKGRDDPSRILGIETIDPKMPCKEPQPSECFEADLAEVTEAHGTERQTVCAHYDCMVIENHWTEDTPMERYYRIWTLRESDRASIWLQRGYFSRFELLRGLSATNTVVLAHAIQESHLFEWGQKYGNKNDQGWTIGGNAWSITLIAGNLKVSTEGLDAFPPMLTGLCRNLRKLGVPVRFRENRGLEYAPIRKQR